MAAGVLVSVRAVASRIITDLKTLPVEKLLNHSEPALIARLVNIDGHFSLVPW
jgi:hypothetical protein